MSRKQRIYHRLLILLVAGSSVLILALRMGSGKDSAALARISEDHPAVRSSAGTSYVEISRTQQAPLDWKRLCEIADDESTTNWSGWHVKTARYRQRLAGLPLDSLLDLLSGITGLACSEAATREIDTLILHAIIEKDPASGFDLAMDRLRANPDYGFTMSAEFREWVGKDDEAAERWLTRQDWNKWVGTSNSPFAGMGSALVSRHLNENLDQAGVLIHRLPMASRFEIIQYGFTNCDRTFDDASAAAFIRQSLNHEEQPRMFGEVYGTLGFSGDYPKIDRVIQAITASAEERNEIVVAASKARMSMGTGKGPQESLDEIRGWVSRQSPEVLDRVTGELLSIMSDRDFDHKEAEEFIRKYHAAGAGDDLIHSFLASKGGKKSPETVARMEALLRTRPE